MRLACVKHAASVRSEPGSNSQVHQTQSGQNQTKPNEQDPNLSDIHPMVHKNHRTLEASVNAYRKTHQQTPKAKPKKPGSKPQKPKPNRYQPEGQYLKDAANVSLPIPDLTLKERPNLFEPSGFVVVGRRLLDRGAQCVNGNIRLLSNFVECLLGSQLAGLKPHARGEATGSSGRGGGRASCPARSRAAFPST